MTLSRDDGFDFAADHPLEAFELTFRGLRPQNVTSEFVTLPHPMIRRFALALRTLSVEDWTTVQGIAPCFHNPDLIKHQYKAWVDELGEDQARELSSIAAAAQAGVIHTYLAWIVRQETVSAGQGDPTRFEAWANLIAWLVPGRIGR